MHLGKSSWLWKSTYYQYSRRIRSILTTWGRSPTPVYRIIGTLSAGGTPLEHSARGREKIWGSSGTGRTRKAIRKSARGNGGDRSAHPRIIDLSVDRRRATGERLQVGRNLLQEGPRFAGV